MAQVSMASIPALKDSFAQLKTRMDKAVEDFRKEMTATRTGRASVHMLDGVTVDAYGSPMPLNQLANVSAPEPQLITVQPWDVSLIGAIKKAMKDKKITEDEERGAMENLQKLTDDEIKKMEEMAKGKEKEVMSV